MFLAADHPWQVPSLLEPSRQFGRLPSWQRKACYPSRHGLFLQEPSPAFAELGVIAGQAPATSFQALSPTRLRRDNLHIVRGNECATQQALNGLDSQFGRQAPGQAEERCTEALARPEACDVPRQVQRVRVKDVCHCPKRLAILKIISALNCRLIDSRIGKVLNTKKFRARCGRPETWLRRSLPSVPPAQQMRPY